MISKGIICPTISYGELQLTPIIKNARTNYRYAKALNHFVTIRHSQIIPNCCTISALCSCYAEEHDGASHSSLADDGRFQRSLCINRAASPGLAYAELAQRGNAFLASQQPNWEAGLRQGHIAFDGAWLIALMALEPDLIGNNYKCFCSDLSLCIGREHCEKNQGSPGQ
jgi:hypothetical protein